MSDESHDPRASDRRRLLRALAGMGLALGAVELSGCNGAEEGATGVRLALDRVPEGERIRVMVDGDPVELVRRDDEVRARSLLCTHFGCEVRWSPEEDQYRCPCHDGRFDPAGHPVAGPPTRPLRELSARISDGDVVIRPAPDGAPR